MRSRNTVTVGEPAVGYILSIYIFITYINFFNITKLIKYNNYIFIISKVVPVVFDNGEPYLTLKYIKIIIY